MNDLTQSEQGRQDVAVIEHLANALRHYNHTRKTRHGTAAQVHEAEDAARDLKRSICKAMIVMGEVMP